jgi:hypothetical protein
MSVSDKMINDFIGKIMAFLSLYNGCFVGGAFVFEDNDASLYNLLTYNNLNVPNADCHSTEFSSNTVSYKQSKTHGVFLKKFDSVNCVPKIKLNIAGCKEGRCIKFERLITLNHICDVCKPNSERANDKSQTKRVILYYPFANEQTNKKYLYVKLESHKMLSSGHLVDAVNAYALKNKTPERRETDPYTNTLENFDNDFYNKMSEYFGINSSDLQQYNNQIRNGAEFYVSFDLLNLFIDFFLDRELISHVCSNPALKPKELSHRKRHSSSKSSSKSLSKKLSNKSASKKLSNKSASKKSLSKSASKKSLSKSASNKSSNKTASKKSSNKTASKSSNKTALKKPSLKRTSLKRTLLKSSLLKSSAPKRSALKTLSNRTASKSMRKSRTSLRKTKKNSRILKISDNAFDT